MCLTSIYDSGEDRENRLLRLALHHCGFGLLGQAGLLPACHDAQAPVIGAWVALNLPRSVVFADPGLPGDVDMLAGALRGAFPESALLEAIRKWQALPGPEVPVAQAARFATMELVAAHGVVWPPVAEHPLVAIEAKASKFSAAETWERTHTNKARRVLGQLRLLRDRGLDFVSLLHLATTQPLASATPWRDAGGQVARATGRQSEGHPRFPDVGLGDGPYGHFVWMHGAIARADPTLHGTSSDLIVRALPRRVRTRDRNVALWRGTFVDLLGQLPPPTTTTPVFGWANGALVTQYASFELPMI